MTIEFVLNVSGLEKIFSACESQCLDSAMSTICHIVKRALPHEMDFCSHVFTIVLHICLTQPRLRSGVGGRLLLIAGTGVVFKALGAEAAFAVIFVQSPSSLEKAASPDC
jgi:hypothetical protein